jgi:hypothetical protein
MFSHFMASRCIVPLLLPPMLNPHDAPLKDMGEWPEFARIQMNQAVQQGIYIVPRNRH